MRRSTCRRVCGTTISAFSLSPSAFITVPSPKTDPQTSTFLTPEERRDVLAILGLGCDEGLAAAYVGRPVECLATTARRFKTFRRDLEKAKTQARVNLIVNVRNASRNERYWRAAAWALERLDPERYGPERLKPAADAARYRPMIESLVEILLEEIPEPKTRKAILKRLNQFLEERFQE